MQLSQNAQELKYATYLSEPGAHLDAGGYRSDKRGILYLAGCVAPEVNWPVTQNAWATNSLADYNSTVLKMVFTEYPQVAFSADIQSNKTPATVQFNSSSVGNLTYLWNFGDGATASEPSPMHTYQTACNYIVTVSYSYENGCTLTDTVAVIPVDGARSNIFTPNGDGINDEFRIYINEKPFDLRIYNRWGNVVTEIKDYHLKQNWKAEDVPDGLYFYQVTTNDGESWKGWVEIVR